MKRIKTSNLLLSLITLTGITSFLFSCNNKDTTSSDVSSKGINYADTTIYKKIYSKDGFVLLQDKNYKQEPHAPKKSAPIEDTTAARMVRYFNNNPSKKYYPKIIDFEISSVLEILKELSADEGGIEKKSLRIYLGSYYKRVIDSLYKDSSVNYKKKIMNYTTAILVGRYDSVEFTKAHNLGNLCPPNCIPAESTVPDEMKSKIYKISGKLEDVPQHEPNYE